MSNKLCWVFRIEDSMTGEEMKRYIEQGRLYRDKRGAYYYYFHGVVSEVQKPTKPLNGLKVIGYLMATLQKTLRRWNNSQNVIL